MINRRSFIGNLFASAAGYFGLSKVAKAEVKQDEFTTQQKANIYSVIHQYGMMLRGADFKVYKIWPDGFRDDGSSTTWELSKLLNHPNKEDSFVDLMYFWNQQLSLTSMALTWMVPNVLGTPYELYAIPIAIAIPQPKHMPEYPDGYWRIQPIYPYGPFNSHPIPSPTQAVGTIISHQWMMRFNYLSPINKYGIYPDKTLINLQLEYHNQMDRDRYYAMKHGTYLFDVFNRCTTYSELEDQLSKIKEFVLQPRCNLIANGLTKQLAPFFGEDLKVEITI